jgi:hypothetical protein
MAGLDLRSRAGMLTGGARGPALVPSKAAESLLYKAAAREGSLQMPPGKQVLKPADVAALKTWIDAGAPWSDTTSTREEPSWWSFRRIAKPPLPSPAAAHPIDTFVSSALAREGLQAAPPADRRTLIRRAMFDLHGVPPTPEEVDAFVHDKDPQAYAKLLDRLLASPRYGERWGRHWLDVVRYADTGGFETDVYLASAWRYRDYVIRSLNADKPYNVFVQEQIAADEIWPDNLELDGAYELPKSKRESLERRLGTALYTLGALPVEYTLVRDQYQVEWQNEAAELTGAAFLGLSLNCARCHDHKFDPISQRDYYKLAALFAGSEDREVPIVSQMEIFEYTRHQARVVIVDQLKAKLQRLDAQVRQRKGGYTPEERDQRESLLRAIGEAYVKAPEPYAKANLLVHTERVPDTHLLTRGEYLQKGEVIQPGFPAALGNAPAIEEPNSPWFVPRRRKALAEWLTSPDHPLLARVMVNRVWQGHFGRGIVATANDFGRQGDPPSHPELLDWLAAEFQQTGWSLKSLHKTIMLSEAYQRSSQAVSASLAKDPENRLLWRMNRRRLEAETLRDTVLTVAGALNPKMFGEPVVPTLSREEMDGMRDAQQWPVTSDPAEHDRRGIYLFVKRSFRNPMMEAFDAPDTTFSCPRRESSTVAPQSLAMMNSEWMTQQAARLAARLRPSQDPITLAWRIALARPPDAEEATHARAFLQRQGLEKFAMLVLNLSELLYVD